MSTAFLKQTLRTISDDAHDPSGSSNSMSLGFGRLTQYELDQKIRDKADPSTLSPKQKKQLEVILFHYKNIRKIVEGQGRKYHHANFVNFFKLFGTDPADPTKVETPWYYKVLNPASTVRDFVLGVDSKLNGGQASLHTKTMKTRFDVPKFLYNWIFEVFKPSLELGLKSALRPVINSVRSVINFRGIKSFFNRNDAKQEKLTRSQEYVSNVIDRDFSVLQRKIHNILLANDAKFAEVVAYNLYQKGLVSTIDMGTELTEENRKIFQLYCSAYTDPTDQTMLDLDTGRISKKDFKQEILNYQKWSSQEKFSGSVTGLFGVGGQRMAFAGANLLDAVRCTKTVKAFEQSMERLVSNKESRDERLSKLRFKGNGYYPFSLMVREARSAYRDNLAIAAGINDPYPVFEISHNNSAMEYYLKMPVDTRYFPQLELLRRCDAWSESYEWSKCDYGRYSGPKINWDMEEGKPIVENHNPLFSRMHFGLYDRRYQQKVAASFLVNNTGSSVLHTLKRLEHIFTEGKSDDISELEPIHSFARKLEHSVDLILQLSKTYLHTDKGRISDQIAGTVGLQPGSNVADYISGIIKVLHSHEKSFYESHRHPEEHLDNVPEMKVTDINPYTGNPYGIVYNDSMGRRCEKFSTEADHDAFMSNRYARMLLANKALRDLNAKHRQIAGSMYNTITAFRRAESAARKIIAEQENDEDFKNYNEKVTVSTPSERYIEPRMVDKKGKSSTIKSTDPNDTSVTVVLGSNPLLPDTGRTILTGHRPDDYNYNNAAWVEAHTRQYMQQTR